ncbi:uncharacterized protein [Watersipora subatra]|uniref:uncharacterized protein n=1 Tax=Watersipora subatra TaxID=2589382 RepID=UPI00355B1743
MASGISIMTKDIPGVGQMRLRYPIMPIHDFGNVIHMEMQALADMTLKKNKYQRLYPNMRFENGTIEEVYTFETRMSTMTSVSPHVHSFELTSSEIDTLKSGKNVKVTTSQNSGHSHTIEIMYNTKWNTSEFLLFYSFMSGN